MTETLPDGARTTAPSEHHHIRFTIDPGGPVVGRVTCTAPVGASCRLTCTNCDEECTCGDPTLSDYGTCIRAEWVVSSGVVDCYDGPEVTSVRDGEIGIIWDGDNYVWRYLDQVVTSHVFDDGGRGMAYCRHAIQENRWVGTIYCNLGAEWHARSAEATAGGVTR